MHCSYVRSLIGGARVLGRKTINLLACIQKSMNGRVEVQMRWACSHIPAIAQYGYVQPLSNSMMGKCTGGIAHKKVVNDFFFSSSVRLWECQVTASDFTTQDALTSQPVRLVVRGMKLFLSWSSIVNDRERKWSKSSENFFLSELQPQII